MDFLFLSSKELPLLKTTLGNIAVCGVACVLPSCVADIISSEERNHVLFSLCGFLVLLAYQIGYAFIRGKVSEARAWADYERLSGDAKQFLVEITSGNLPVIKQGVSFLVEREGLCGKRDERVSSGIVGELLVNGFVEERGAVLLVSEKATVLARTCRKGRKK